LGSVEKTYPSGHGGGGGSSEVAGSGGPGYDGEERELGAGDGDVGVEITIAAGVGEESGPGEWAARRWYSEPVRLLASGMAAEAIGPEEA
jgi:hypothetical protein